MLIPTKFRLSRCEALCRLLLAGEEGEDEEQHG